MTHQLGCSSILQQWLVGQGSRSVISSVPRAKSEWAPQTMICWHTDGWQIKVKPNIKCKWGVVPPRASRTPSVLLGKMFPRLMFRRLQQSKSLWDLVAVKAITNDSYHFQTIQWVLVSFVNLLNTHTWLDLKYQRRRCSLFRGSVCTIFSDSSTFFC